MRFLLSLMASLVVVAAAPIAIAEAAPAAYSAPSRPVASAPSAKAEFGAGPASTTKLDGRPYFAYDATPGGSIEDHLAIVNFAAHPQTLNVYPVDAVSGVNGAFTYLARSAPRTQVGAWLTVGTRFSGQVTLGPRATLILPVFLHVPASASPGDHAGAVIVSVTGLVKGKHGQLVKFEQRIATKVIIRVSGPLHPRLAIVNMRASYSGQLDPFASGVVSITYTVRNTGNAILGGTQRVSVHGLFGSTALAPALPSIPPLLPGGAVTFSTRVRGVPPEIAVTATVRLSPEGLRGDLNPGIHVTSASVTLWAVPWILVIFVLIVLLAAVALFWRRRRRSVLSRPTSASKSPQGVTS
jgi:hypothetical protein